MAWLVERDQPNSSIASRRKMAVKEKLNGSEIRTGRVSNWQAVFGMLESLSPLDLLPCRWGL